MSLSQRIFFLEFVSVKRENEKSVNLLQILVCHFFTFMNKKQRCFSLYWHWNPLSQQNASLLSDVTCVTIKYFMSVIYALAFQFLSKNDEIKKHPGFVRSTFDSDTALDKVQDETPFPDCIQPVCLSKNANVIKSTSLEESIKEWVMCQDRISWETLLVQEKLSWGFLQEIRLAIQSQACVNSSSFKVSDNMFSAGFDLLLNNMFVKLHVASGCRRSWKQ